jgi:hypothetical protein
MNTPKASSDDEHTTSKASLASVKMMNPILEQIVLAVLFSLFTHWIVTSTFLQTFSFPILLTLGLALLGFSKIFMLDRNDSVCWWYTVGLVVAIGIVAYLITTTDYDYQWWLTLALIIIPVVDLAYLVYERFYKKKSSSTWMMIINVVADVLILLNCSYALFVQ